MIDAHIHTHFSPDSEAEPLEYLEEAIIKGINHITFTDHTDLLYPHDMSFEFDLTKYDHMISDLKQRYGHKVHIYKGIEMGLQKNCIIDSELLLERFKPDFVLCSLHTVEGQDLYYGDFFSKHTPLEAIRIYLQTLLDIVKRFKTFNVIGHLDLPKRYQPAIYDVPLSEYVDLIDAIFDEIIPRGQGIEINSSGLRGPHKRPFPDYEIIAHYIRRGGKIITFGSDSHSADSLGVGYDLITEFLKHEGIKSLYVFKDMIGQEVPI
ncbi:MULTISPECIES: histidinol-phosphatase HisJ family protein [unclassified Fusibacter]|uniref:histidinol-phosphatase HisJ family protein n=1 Tax=unclassified Fusibacter TaxID=2624464 RepID=UPI001011DB28|nr:MULTISPECIES: histidinol-phosphatase HisJ family protein [unclassified Fusibacter]MCK8059419.1 histidinol-phosphatase HisJ family protein [Fusibacter sp. A2]NPE21117.1 histidinol-phosphatase HisJ family protein [Fusibacter sp. A1]RXV62387.1 PHP domain-containing protein [Fusibacter sp. A1]